MYHNIFSATDNYLRIKTITYRFKNNNERKKSFFYFYFKIILKQIIFNVMK